MRNQSASVALVLLSSLLGTPASAQEQGPQEQGPQEQEPTTTLLRDPAGPTGPATHLLSLNDDADDAAENLEALVAATAALAEARATKRGAQGKEGEEKYDIMMQAAAHYEKVASEHVKAKKVVAEAWFRAGEIYRTVRQVEQAEACFKQAAEQKAEPEFGARALNELGHIARRLKEYDKALGLYRQVAERFVDQRKECARALTWQGKVLISQKKVEEGHKLMLSLGDAFPEFPVDHIRNVDSIAVDLIKSGDSERAQTLVDACLSRHSPTAAEDSKAGREIDKALTKMRARELLANEASSSSS